MRTIRNVKLSDKMSFKLTSVLSTLERMLDNEQSSLLWMFRLDSLLLLWFQTKKFTYETGRTCGILQYDKEPALKALVADVAKELGGMSIRATPKDWKQAHGSIGKMQQTLFGQSRTLRLQPQERIHTESNSNHCFLPWIVNHSQFLLNRFLTHEDGHTSYFRKWKKDYQGALCDFGETVLFRMPGKLKNKADTAWHTGIWLGEDTEADESIVQCEGSVLKVRAVKRIIPSEQWNTDLRKLLNGTPWDPKDKDTTDIDFVLPPPMVASGRVRPPPGLRSLNKIRKRNLRNKWPTRTTRNHEGHWNNRVLTLDAHNWNVSGHLNGQTKTS